LFKFFTYCYGVNVCINFAGPALVCAAKLWEMGSRNPVEILQGMTIVSCLWYTGCLTKVTI